MLIIMVVIEMSAKPINHLNHIHRSVKGSSPG